MLWCVYTCFDLIWIEWSAWLWLRVWYGCVIIYCRNLKFWGNYVFGLDGLVFHVTATPMLRSNSYEVEEPCRFWPKLENQNAEHSIYGISASTSSILVINYIPEIWNFVWNFGDIIVVWSQSPLPPSHAKVCVSRNCDTNARIKFHIWHIHWWPRVEEPYRFWR